MTPSEIDSKPLLSQAKPTLKMQKDPPASDMLTPESKEFWKKAGDFMRTGSGGALDPSLLPPLLSLYRKPVHIRHDYPLWVTTDGNASGNEVIQPLRTMLERSLEKTLAPSEGRLLRDNLDRLESLIRDKVMLESKPLEGKALLGEALDKIKHGWNPVDQEQFDSSVHVLLRDIPGGIWVPFCMETPIYLMAALLKRDTKTREIRIQEQIQKLRQPLETMLWINQSKGKEGHSPEKIQSSLGLGSAFINPLALSRVLPESANNPLSNRRLERIRNVLKTFDDVPRLFASETSLALSIAFRHCSEALQMFFPECKPQFYSSEQGFQTLQTRFEVHIKPWIELIKALRIGKLELKEQYDESIHDDYFEHFDWKFMTVEELEMCQPLVMFEEERTIQHNGFSDLSRLLLSEKPVKIVILKTESGSSATDAQGDMLHTLRLELGEVAVSHRQTYVAQASTALIQHCVTSITRGLNIAKSALLYVLSSPSWSSDELQPWLLTHAAIEGREFPLFSYDPEKGSLWGSRFSTDINPSAFEDWPEYEIMIETDAGQNQSRGFDFTFADYASLIPEFRSNFLLVPDACVKPEMVPLQEFLQGPQEQYYRQRPFIWMADTAGKIHRVLVSFAIVRTCKERLDFWHMLQDLGGTRNYHAEIAAEKARREVSQEYEQKIEELEQAHARKIQQVSQNAARQTMENLARTLLNLDAGESVFSATSAPMHSTTVSPRDDKSPTLSTNA
ncbi:MAG: hypothetical protein HQM12_19875, partial [SAR324 cluster bacterium]|nr:hypothetical protein [SAR324 cluster bacterium]